MNTTLLLGVCGFDGHRRRRLRQRAADRADQFDYFGLDRSDDLAAERPRDRARGSHRVRRHARAQRHTGRLLDDAGPLTPPEVETVNGVATTIFLAGSISGTTRINAYSGGISTGSGNSSGGGVDVQNRRRGRGFPWRWSRHRQASLKAAGP